MGVPDFTTGLYLPDFSRTLPDFHPGLSPRTFYRTFHRTCPISRPSRQRRL